MKRLASLLAPKRKQHPALTKPASWTSQGRYCIGAQIYIWYADPESSRPIGCLLRRLFPLFLGDMFGDVFCDS